MVRFFWKEFNSPLLGYRKLPLFSDSKQTLSQVARWLFIRQYDPICQLLRALAKSSDFLKFEQNTVIPDFGSNLKCLHSYLALRNWNISWFWHEKIKFLICFVFFIKPIYLTNQSLCTVRDINQSIREGVKNCLNGSRKKNLNFKWQQN